MSTSTLHQPLNVTLKGSRNRTFDAKTCCFRCQDRCYRLSRTSSSLENHFAPLIVVCLTYGVRYCRPTLSMQSTSTIDTRGTTIQPLQKVPPIILQRLFSFFQRTSIAESFLICCLSTEEPSSCICAHTSEVC